MVCDLGVVLGGLYAFMAEHLGNTFYGNAIGEGEGVACAMEGEDFVDTAEVGNFFEVGVHFWLLRMGSRVFS